MAVLNYTKSIHHMVAAPNGMELCKQKCSYLSLRREMEDEHVFSKKQFGVP
jgi:hypothetical protein